MSTSETSPPPVPAGPEKDFVRAERYRRQLETVAENATLALFIMDERQHCTYMNPAAERLTGYRLEEVQGEPLHDYVHHTHPDGTPYPLEECPIDRAFPQNMREQGEEVFVHKDGHFYPVAFTASPILDDAGQPVGTIIEVRDITEERREEAERERLLWELETERTRLATVFQQVPAFIATTRGPDHVFEMANPAYLQMVGHREVVGKAVREALPEVVEQGFVALLDQVYRSGEPYVGTEVRVLLQTTPGAPMEERFVNFVYQPLPGPDGRSQGIMAHGVDITELLHSRRLLEEQAAEMEAQTEELQRANEEIARERARFAAVIEHAPVGIVIAEAPSGRIVAGNRRVEEIFRHPVLQSENVDAYAEWIAFHPDGRRVKGHEYPLGRVFDTGRLAGPDEYLYQRGDGTQAWVQITGAPLLGEHGELVAGLVVIDDIDAEKRAQEERERLIAELETGRARLQQIFTEAPAVMALYSGPEHVITLVNPTWEKTVGKPGAVGRPFREVFPEFEGSGLFEMLDRIYETGEPFVNPEVNVPLERWGSGVLEDTYWNLVWRPLAGDGSHGRDILVHAVEVTAQVRARQEVERKAEELSRLALRLEVSNRDLDQFAYAASHDLKAPLRGIANLAAWIEEDLGERVTEDARQHLDLLRGRVHRMEGLIDGILQYSRAGRVREAPERVEVAPLVHEVVDLLSPPDGAEVRVGEGMPALVAERLPLQQVFMNLIGNALKYNRNASPWVEVTAEVEGERVHFRVADNGPGIAPEYHERIFGIFQTLQGRDEVEGTGIGLSLVRKLVESRGGRIWVESSAGEGATFHFLWPKETGDVAGE